MEKKILYNGVWYMSEMQCWLFFFMEVVDILDKDELRYDCGTMEDENA